MKRIFGIDLIRSLAVIFVLSVHFFFNNGFYQCNVKGISMFLSILLRWTFYNGVPLFLLITGYLKKDKKLSNKYYKGIIKVLSSYLFISFLCIIFRKYIIHEHIRLYKLLMGVFNFTTVEYAWYIEMYIGLFLLIPFLNLIYDGLKTKNNKIYLIFTLILLVSIEPLFNFLHYKNITFDIVPDWWVRIYPLVYYFIGCFIREYQIKINKLKGLIFLMLLILIETVISYLYNYNDVFSWDFIGGYGSLQTVIISTIIFLLLYNIEINNHLITNVIKKISVLSLDIYLLSYMVDCIVYDHLGNVLYQPSLFLKYCFPTVFVVLSLSFILASLKSTLFNIFDILKNNLVGGSK